MRAALPWVVAMAAAWLALYHDVLRRLIDDWRVDENYSHGFLLPLVSAYAIWTERAQLARTPVHPHRWLGAALLLVAIVLLLAGIVGAELTITRWSMVLSLFALTLYFGGAAWCRRLAFPLGLLLLAVPIPNLLFNQVAFPLQLLASEWATQAIRLFGVPALREGNVIELARLRLQVVEACSGIRSLVALTALAVVYAYFFETNWWRRAAIIIAVVPIAIVVNAARVAGTGVLAHSYGAAAAEGFFHGFSGLLVFGVAVALLLLLAQGLNVIERKWR